MTELLFLKDCYLREFDAKIIESDNDYVVLDRTVFYPEGGGQPSDRGRIDNANVIKVTKEKNIVKHYIDRKIDEGLSVHCILDWNLRYAHMRMHSAQHLLSAIVLDEYGAETAGNQINAEHSRIDFYPLKEYDLNFITARFNELVDKAFPIKIYFTTRENVIKSIDEKRRNLFNRISKSVKEIRIVEIEGTDKVPCAGTHVKNTNEIGHINILRTENKGKDTKRIVFGLVK